MQNAEMGEKYGNIFGRVEKSNMIRTIDTTQRNKSDGNGVTRKTKRIPRQSLIIHTKHKNGNTPQFTQSNTQIIPNWKYPGLDGIHRFCCKRFTSILDKLAPEVDT